MLSMTGVSPAVPPPQIDLRENNREVGARGRGGTHHHCGSDAQDARRGLLSLGKTWLEPAPAPIVSTVRQDGTRGITVHRPGFPHQAGRRKEDSGQSSRGALLRSPTTVAYLRRGGGKPSGDTALTGRRPRWATDNSPITRP